MEELLYSINSMRTMDVIDINNGARLGNIKDIRIDYENSKIISLLVEELGEGWFSKKEEIEIKWRDIVKIGVDVILVNLINEVKENGEIT
ncbi:YlmC/YmxH family sporulation protein [Clostridium sp. MSJ-8]|uniref:YlmC/YmxH family sporulation protein n=1 Tax=Clostridium sp. MSJ-8 TaxID=2841510 RepID=UPI001C0EEB21|nr:YlmC/YmxH family sporulation protein [Clostridium sp. MSJ-8]MBU5487789.1 YlmC/YmxH family sporulation protein [Clostridium sp. MSJ-8]